MGLAYARGGVAGQLGPASQPKEARVRFPPRDKEFRTTVHDWLAIDVSRRFAGLRDTDRPS